MLRRAQTLAVYAPPEIAADGTETRRPLGTVRAAVSAGPARESREDGTDCAICSAAIVLSTVAAPCAFPRGTTLMTGDGSSWTVRTSVALPRTRPRLTLLRCTRTEL